MGPLRGAGVDAERVERFAELAHGPRPWPLVFSAREAAHLMSLPDPAWGFCAAFCCKEALCKALGEPYPFPACEVLARPGQEEQELRVDPELRERHGIGAVVARVLVDHRADRGELVAAVCLFDPPAPPAA